MKSRFDPEEWTQLLLFPYVIFALIAGADRVIDKKERAQFQKELDEHCKAADPLQALLYEELKQADSEALLHQAKEPEHFQARIMGVRKILSTVLTLEEFTSFTCSMFATGLRVAQASGGGWFGLGDPVSPKERAALNLYSTHFGLDSQTLEGYLTSK